MHKRKTSKPIANLKSILSFEGGTTTKNFKFKYSMGFQGEWWGYLPYADIGDLDPKTVYISGFPIEFIMAMFQSGNIPKIFIGITIENGASGTHDIVSFELVISGRTVKFIKNDESVNGSYVSSPDHDTFGYIFSNEFMDVFQDVEVRNVVVKKL